MKIGQYFVMIWTKFVA